MRPRACGCYHARMETLTVKLPPPLRQALERASRRSRLSKSELARRAIAAFLVTDPASNEGPGPSSALARAGDLVGCFKGGPKDLASNPQHLADFGR